VSVTRGTGRVTITARTDALRVSETLTPRTFDLIVTDGRDSVQIAGDVEGRVAVRRSGRTLAISLARATAAKSDGVRRLLQGSPALARLGELVNSAWGRSHKDAMVLVSAHATAALLQGEFAPLTLVARRRR
jgi:hypothetical protein